MKNNYEFRSVRASVKGNTITGLIPYGTLSEDLGGFRERITPTAFRHSLENRDIKALHLHDDAKELGRLSNNRLKLRDTEAGLQIELNPIMTSYAKDAVMLVNEMKDHGGFSFGFLIRDKNIINEDGVEIHELTDVELYEVSVVNDPAYEIGSQIGLRGLDQAKRDNEETMEEENSEEVETEVTINDLKAIIETLISEIQEVKSIISPPEEEEETASIEDEEASTEEPSEEESDEEDEKIRMKLRLLAL